MGNRVFFRKPGVLHYVQITHSDPTPNSLTPAPYYSLTCFSSLVTFNYDKFSEFVKINLDGDFQ